MTDHRICMVFEDGDFKKIVSDLPIRAYFVDESCPNDRVYELSENVEIGVEKVQQVLRNSLVGHIDDDTLLGLGYGPRKTTPRPSLKLIDDDDQED